VVVSVKIIDEKNRTQTERKARKDPCDLTRNLGGASLEHLNPCFLSDEQ
jgi:hypothetical protein